MLIPLDAKDKQSAKICYIKDSKIWACLNIEDGRMQSCDFIDDWQIDNRIFDCVVLIDESEDIWSFIEASILPLKVSGQSDIEEIVEAFIFRMLYEIEY
jgi:hypothetical protein